MPRQKKDREPISNDTESIVLRVLGRFASILLRIGLDAPRAEYLLRCAFVSEAAMFARNPGGRLTQSQIALLAGVNRLDVRKILESKHEMASGNRFGHQSRLERIIAAWRHDPEFSNGRGRPKKLSFTGAGNQFEKLVRKYGRDVTARTLRDNLTRRKLATTKEGRLILSNRADPAGRRAAAALSDLSFLSSQLSQFEVESVSRTFATRSLVLPARDKKTLKLIQRKSVAKIETALNSLESLKQAVELSKDDGVRRRHRLRIVTIFSSETDREDNRKP